MCYMVHGTGVYTYTGVPRTTYHMCTRVPGYHSCKLQVNYYRDLGIIESAGYRVPQIKKYIFFKKNLPGYTGIVYSQIVLL